jgi:hypothetical protein
MISAYKEGVPGNGKPFLDGAKMDSGIGSNPPRSGSNGSRNERGDHHYRRSAKVRCQPSSACRSDGE